MDITQRYGKGVEDLAPILQELQSRVDEHGTPVVVRGRHAEIGWVIFIKDGDSAVLISENAYVAFVE